MAKHIISSSKYLEHAVRSCLASLSPSSPSVLLPATLLRTQCCFLQRFFALSVASCSASSPSVLRTAARLRTQSYFLQGFVAISVASCGASSPSVLLPTGLRRPQCCFLQRFVVFTLLFDDVQVTTKARGSPAVCNAGRNSPKAKRKRSRPKKVFFCL